MASEALQPHRSNWQLQARKGGIYALSILIGTEYGRDSTTNVIKRSTVGGVSSRVAFADLAAREFLFKVSPRSINLEEPAAVVVTPTQDGGQFVEHHGQIYKNISISGTNGFRPNRSHNGAVIPVLNMRNPFVTPIKDPETNLPVGERTGFDDLIDLRNFFTEYYNLKKNPDAAPYTIMVWQNGMEGEFFVVEPITFRVMRDSKSPLTATYDMQLRTIERLDLSNFLRYPDSYIRKNSSNSFFARMRRLAAKIARALAFVQSVIGRIVSLGKSVVTTIFQPIINIISGLTGIASAARGVFEITRGALSNLRDRLEELYVELDGLTSPFSSSGIIDDNSRAANACKNLGRAIDEVYSEDRLFTTPLSTKTTKRAAAYTDLSTGKPRSGGDPSDLSNERAGGGASEVTINIGDDIRRIAKQNLGHASRWKVLVMLNDLKPPYISPDGDGKNVLRPGIDRILIPSANTAGVTAIAQNPSVPTGATRFEDRLGRDIKLNNDAALGGISVFDFAVSSSGDVELIEGSSNMKQAVRIKFETEQGELPAHPKFGIRFPLGVRLPELNSFIGFQVQAKATLFSDSRVSDVPQFDLSFEGNTVSLKSTIVVRGADQALAVNLSVRR